MKKLLVFAFAAMLGFSANAQEASWKQMEDFHGVMSKTFHPAEEGNLKPLNKCCSSTTFQPSTCFCKA